MNKLKALLIILCAAGIGSLAYAAALPTLPQPAESSSLPSSSVSFQPAELAKRADAASGPAVSPASSSEARATSSKPPAEKTTSSTPAVSDAEPAASATALSTSTDAQGQEEIAVPDAAAGAVAAISSQQLDPGETLVITVTGAQSPEDLAIKNDFGFTPRFSPLDETTYISFLPLSYFTQPGQYTISVTGSDFLEPASFEITVTNKQFEVQQLTVKEETAEDTIFSDEASKEYRAKIWPLKELYDDTRYFDGRFLLPVEGPITTQFGMIRYVNGQPNPRHDGVDLSAAAGTPVQCAQNGKVLFADFVKLTGNTVVVEHGYGLKSWYFHMQSLDVEAGDSVKTGDVLGKVGSTGFSTGPHLHFSASVNGVYINPFTLVETDLLDAVIESLP